MNSFKLEFSNEEEDKEIIKLMAKLILIESIKRNAQEIKINIRSQEDIPEVLFIIEGQNYKMPPPPRDLLHKVVEYLKVLSYFDSNKKAPSIWNTEFSIP